MKNQLVSDLLKIPPKEWRSHLQRNITFVKTAFHTDTNENKMMPQKFFEGPTIAAIYIPSKEIHPVSVNVSQIHFGMPVNPIKTSKDGTIYLDKRDYELKENSKSHFRKTMAISSSFVFSTETDWEDVIKGTTLKHMLEKPGIFQKIFEEHYLAQDFVLERTDIEKELNEIFANLLTLVEESMEPGRYRFDHIEDNALQITRVMEPSNPVYSLSSSDKLFPNRKHITLRNYPLVDLFAEVIGDYHNATFVRHYQFEDGFQSLEMRVFQLAPHSVGKKSAHDKMKNVRIAMDAANKEYLLDQKENRS